MAVTTIAAMALGAMLVLVLLSYGVEAVRRRPIAPTVLAWAPDLSQQWVNLDGVRVRYVKTGAGPNLVLLHTLRTQLDIFQKILPQLAAHFTVYAFDYPGHGWSDIPDAAYAPDDFYQWTAAFLDTLDVRQASLAGISIGGTIALVLAAREHPRVARVVAINPYDYPPAGGIRRSSFLARLILGPADVPILGATLMRLRNRFVSDRIMEGGVATPAALPADLKKELDAVGARPGHYQGFLRLLSFERQWSAAPSQYGSIRVPTMLVYGDQDWAPAAHRTRIQSLIPGVDTATVSGGGHFLSLDRPRELSDLARQFIDRSGVERAGT